MPAKNSSIALKPDRLLLNGRSQIVLCASLFYFRIPRAYWRERMEQLVQYGYHAIDVYFPWNYHEREEGTWDFAGERDAKLFLKLAAEAGLWVVARPGPYICSEWDGGALPAYLRKDEASLRNDDPIFLGHVARWFDKIMPILQRYELGNGGTVIAVQLDNELDFFDCSDPQRYIRSLRDMALARGISVPLIACAGQGGLTEASGDVPGVVPTCNFYPDNQEPAVEQAVLAYQQLLTERGFPLLVTETNRSHFLLRRLLSCGVKLLGPYLQVSGTDFGFTNAINNWGQPLAFMTSDYDFGGMISPEGHVRPEAFEARMLRRLLDVYGEDLAAAAPSPEVDLAIEKSGSAPHQPHGISVGRPDEQGGERTLPALQALREIGYDTGPHVLALLGGGQLAFVSDLTRQISLALPLRVRLDRWGFAGEIAMANVELFHRIQSGDDLTLFFCADEALTAGSVLLRFAQAPALIQAEGGSAETAEGDVRLSFEGAHSASFIVRLQDGSKLRLIAMPRSDALLLRSMDKATGACEFDNLPGTHADVQQSAVEKWMLASADSPDVKATLAEAGAMRAVESAWPLESIGIYRGYAGFKADAPQPTAVQQSPSIGVLVVGASDIVTVYADSRYVGTFVPGGSSRYLPFDEPTTVSAWSGRIEIWGHSNFDDLRLPALRLASGKGVQNLITVHSNRNLTHGWRFRRLFAANLPPQLLSAEQADDTWPLTAFGAWHPIRPVYYELYSRQIALSPEADAFVLHFDGLKSTVEVYIDGSKAGTVSPTDPWLTLTPHVKAGGKHRLALLLERKLGAQAGQVRLLEGRSAANWKIASTGEAELLRLAESSEAQATEAAWPIRLEPGQTAWLTGALSDTGRGKGWRVRVSGANMKLSVLLDERLIARIWLPGGAERPTMTGGSPDSFYIPGAWIRGPMQSRIRLLLEAVVPASPGMLESLIFHPV